jgi:pimeloyl-ACP methyl ester carboxylesterase
VHLPSAADTVGEMADAVVLPGGSFGPGAGLLMYAGAVPAARGAAVHRHSWSPDRPDPFEPPIEDWVRADVTPLLDRVGGTPLLIGKSLGTSAAALAAERALPAVWLTPLLTLPWVRAALERATAPFLLVGGTADPYWDPAVARRAAPHVLEVDGADHGMFVPGPVTASVAVLARVVEAMDEFVDAIGFTPPAPSPPAPSGGPSTTAGRA